MATVIDSLVLELGLDPTKFTQGQRDALNSLRAMQQESERGGKAVEEQTRRIGGVLSNFKREAVSALAIFAGGYGLKELINNVTTMDASTGRLGKTIAMTGQEISAWQGAIRQVGGAAETANAGLASMNAQVVRFSQTGELGSLGIFTKMGVSLYDMNGKLKTAGQLYRDLAEGVKANKISDREAAGFLTGMGVDQNFINLILSGELEQKLAAARKAGVPTDGDIERAQKFQGSFALFIQASENAGRALMQYLYGPLTLISDKLRELIERSPLAAGALGALGGILGLSALRRGAQRLAPGVFGQATGTSLAGRAAGLVGGTVTGPLGMLLASTDPAQGGGERPWHPVTNPGGKRPADWSIEMEQRLVAEHQRGGPAPSLPSKPGSGTVSPAMREIASMLSGIGEIKQATAFNDPYHALLGGGSAHSAGRAVDVTIKDPSQSAEVAQKIRQTLAERGVKATVLDEYRNPSRNSTGGHIHVGIDNDTALRLGGGPLGAGSAARDGARDGAGGASNTTTVSIGTVMVNAPQAVDAGGIAKEISPALQRELMAGAANSGPQ